MIENQMVINRRYDDAELSEKRKWNVYFRA
jgi:hypothetical protein